MWASLRSGADLLECNVDPGSKIPLRGPELSRDIRCCFFSKNHSCVRDLQDGSQMFNQAYNRVMPYVQRGRRAFYAR